MKAYLYLAEFRENATISSTRGFLDSNSLTQEPMSTNMQLHYIPVTAFSYTDLFLDRISLEWDSRGSAMTSHKKLIDVNASLDRNCESLSQKKRFTKSSSVYKNVAT